MPVGNTSMQDSEDLKVEEEHRKFNSFF